MNRRGHRGKVDANQAALVRELRQLGYSVVSLASVGDGCPDILCGDRRTKTNYLFELKDGTKPPSARKLTEAEAAFHAAWCGQIAVVETTEQALRVMGR